MKYPSRYAKDATSRQTHIALVAAHAKRGIGRYASTRIPTYHQGNLFVLDVGEPLVSLFQPVVSNLKITDNASQ